MTDTAESQDLNTSHPSETQPYVIRGTPEFRRVSLSFFAAGLATFAILYSIQPLFPIFSNRFHVTPAVASLSLSVTTTFIAVILPFAGALSDAFGRKPMMALSMLGSSLLCIASAFAPNFDTLVVIRGLLAITLAGLPAVAMAYLSEEVDKHSLGYAMGLYISGNSIGGLAGRLLVSSISDWFSWRVGIGVLGAASLLACLYFWRSLPVSKHFQPQPLKPRHLVVSFGRGFRDPGLVLLYTMGALFMGSFVTLYNYIGFRLLAAPYDLSQSVIGLIFFVYLVGTFSSSWMGRLADKVGRRKVLILNVFIMGVGAVITLERNLLVIIIGVAIFTFGFFGGHSTASSWVGRRALSAKGQASSLYLLFFYIGSGVGGSTGGILWANHHWPGVIAMISSLMLVALITSIVLMLIPPIEPMPASSEATGPA